MVRTNNRRYNTRKKTTAQWLIFIAKILAILIIITLTVWGVTKIKDIDALQTKVEWQIDSSLPITQTLLERKIQPLIRNKYQLDLIKIKHALERESWVAKAHIKRLFFNTIQINIESQQIAMRWKNIDCKIKNAPSCSGYISNNGILFTPKKKVKSDATLARSKAKQTIIAQVYQDYQNYQQISKKMLIKSFSKTHIDQLLFKPNIKVILGYQQKQQRLKKFLKAYEKLRKKISKADLNQATFDMRYPKGFSLRY